MMVNNHQFNCEVNKRNQPVNIPGGEYVDVGLTMRNKIPKSPTAFSFLFMMRIIIVSKMLHSERIIQ